jgi:response regulator RpfG family c-di-GMP phosphodiesterase
MNANGSDQNSQMHDARTSPTSKQKDDQLNILIVDDEPNIRKTLSYC